MEPPYQVTCLPSFLIFKVCEETRIQISRQVAVRKVQIAISSWPHNGYSENQLIVNITIRCENKRKSVNKLILNYFKALSTLILFSKKIQEF